jgi:competence protein CoiA
MKFALVDGERREAKRGLSGKCPLYGHAMIPKCGKIRDPHWAHLANCTCDHWWEPETPWHRAWKNHFPETWQEIVHQSEDGEKHIADVKTDRGVVLEFQHSFLQREERESREKFYRNMVWVVNGLRRVRDRSRFFESLARASIVKAKPLTYSLRSNEGALLRDWVDSHSPVFFDFGDNSEPGDPPSFGGPILWRLEPRSPKGEAHLSPVLKTSFLDKFLKGLPLEGIDYRQELQKLRAVYAALLQQASRPQPLIGFERYWANKQMARARRRF